MLPNPSFDRIRRCTAAVLFGGLLFALPSPTLGQGRLESQLMRIEIEERLTLLRIQSEHLRNKLAIVEKLGEAHHRVGELQRSKAEHQLQTARMIVQAAAHELEVAKVNRQRIEELAESKAVSDAERLKAQVQEQASVGKLRGSEIAVQLHENELALAVQLAEAANLERENALLDLRHQLTATEQQMKFAERRLEALHQRIGNRDAGEEEAEREARDDGDDGDSDGEVDDDVNDVNEDSQQVRQLLQQRVEVLKSLVDQSEQLVKTGRIAFDELAEAQIRLSRAELEMADSPEERIAILERAVAFATAIEKYAQGRASLGAGNGVLDARVRRLDLAIELARERAGLGQDRNDDEDEIEVSRLFFGIATEVEQDDK